MKASASNLSPGAHDILRVLKDEGPLTNSQIMEKAPISSAAFYINKARLEELGLVSSAKDGRKVIISLTEGSPEPVTSTRSAAKKTVKVAPAAAPTPAAKSRTVAAASVETKVRPLPKDVTGGLHALHARTRPIEDAETKVAVLREIGACIPPELNVYLERIVKDITDRAA